MSENAPFVALLMRHFSLCWNTATTVLFLLGLVLGIVGLCRAKNAAAFLTIGCLLLEIAGCLLMPRNILHVSLATAEAWQEFHSFCKWSIGAAYLIPLSAVVALLSIHYFTRRLYAWPAMIGAFCMTTVYICLRNIM